MRFYHCFLTDLPDQFVEANAEALIRWVDGWADQARYYRRAQIVDNVALAVIGEAGKIRWPTLVSSSDKMLQLWMRNKGDNYHGRYWDTLAADQRGAADPAGDPGRDLAVALALTLSGITARNAKLATLPRSGGRAGGKRLTKQQIMVPVTTRILPGTVTWIGIGLGAEQDRPPLKRDGIVAGEIVGYRCWRLDQGFLRSVYQGDIWPPQQTLQGRELADWKQRGIHAWKSAASKQYFEYLRSYMDRRDDGGVFGRTMLDLGEKCPAMVTGSVLLWGDVVEHERGWRAEFAKVRSLDWLYPDAAMMGREREALQALRVRYGVTEESPR